MLHFAVFELPDIAPALEIPRDRAREIGARLSAIGLSGGFLSRLARVGQSLDDALRTPMRAWSARRMKEPAAVAARLFMLHDPVGDDEARSALGDLGPWFAGGFVEARGRELLSPFHLSIAGDLRVFGDRPGAGPEAVPPLCGATLDLARAAMPRGGAPMPGRLLDLGCGAGTLALLFARAAGRVVASDVNPRALAWARLNAAVNGIEGVDFRLGAGFEPVCGEAFDRILSHPPFLASPRGSASSTFAHGGPRGDEIALRLLGDAPEHLAPGGLALVLADWPLFDGEPLDARVRAAVGASPTDVLVLQSPNKNLDEYCVAYAAAEHPDLGEPFRRAATAQRDHLEGLGLRGVALALVVLRRRPTEDTAGWTSLLPVRHPGDAPITPGAIERLLGARSLAYGPEDALLAARLRMPEGASAVSQPLPDGVPPALVIKLPPDRPEFPVAIDAPTAAVIARIAEAPRVADAAMALAPEGRGSRGQAASGEVARLARDALLRGALEATGEPAGSSETRDRTQT